MLLWHKPQPFEGDQWVNNEMGNISTSRVQHWQQNSGLKGFSNFLDSLRRSLLYFRTAGLVGLIQISHIHCSCSVCLLCVCLVAERKSVFFWEWERLSELQGGPGKSPDSLLNSSGSWPNVPSNERIRHFSTTDSWEKQECFSWQFIVQVCCTAEN